jgi:hypothetical protein
MDILINFQDSLLRSVKNDFRRYLHSKINWKQRMIGIKVWKQPDRTLHSRRDDCDAHQ